jgi:hypothetical protein
VEKVEKIQAHIRPHELLPVTFAISNMLKVTSGRAIRTGCISPADLRFLAAFRQQFLDDCEHEHGWLEKVRGRWVHLQMRVELLRKLLLGIERNLGKQCDDALLEQYANNYEIFCRSAAGRGLVRPNFYSQPQSETALEA